ncbi:50S ribosomal protein L20 [Candidatus Parcubacteria bacterium]|nr:50S ribosomal protein L20 [Candidatus Parcubacteria bacterium]
MSRVKKGVNALKTRRNILKQVKGYRFGRSTKEKQAYEAISHAGAYAFAHRRDKKGDMRRLWNVRINAALGDRLSYSKFIGALTKKNMPINRKMLSEIATTNPEAFTRILNQAIQENKPEPKSEPKIEKKAEKAEVKKETKKEKNAK